MGVYLDQGLGHVIYICIPMLRNYTELTQFKGNLGVFGWELPTQAPLASAQGVSPSTFNWLAFNLERS